MRQSLAPMRRAPSAGSLTNTSHLPPSLRKPIGPVGLSAVPRQQLPLKDGRPFGATQVEEITPGVIAAYRDKRGQNEALATGNREMAYLSLIFSWGYERELVKVNRSKASSATRSTPVSATLRIGNTVSSTTWPPPLTT
jgi:hypothetical protein